MFLVTIVMAFREIRRNSVRSLLTMLGVVIGVGSVIALVSIGRGATARVTAELSKLGRNLLMLSPGTNVRGGASMAAPPLELEDARAIELEFHGVELVAPASSTGAQVVYGNKNVRTQVTGSDNRFFDARGYSIAHGRLFSESEVESGIPVCVIGQTARTNLFGNVDPLGLPIRVGRVPCHVIGLLTSKGDVGMGQDQDDIVVMPLRAFQRRISGTRDISIIFVTAAEGRSTAIIAEQMRALMRQRRHRPPGSEDDFTVRDMAEIAATVTSASAALTTLLGTIAAVSLVVGGIGIMNIMLVSVTERTREIGIRLAIGAFASEVMLQFLLEAVVLSTLGGLLGIVLGLAGSFFLARTLDLPFVFGPDIVTLAFLFSALIGVVFGYLPARTAARLNPIDALRHE